MTKLLSEYQQVYLKNQEIGLKIKETKIKIAKNSIFRNTYNFFLFGFVPAIFAIFCISFLPLQDYLAVLGIYVFFVLIVSFSITDMLFDFDGVESFFNSLHKMKKDEIILIVLSFAFFTFSTVIFFLFYFIIQIVRSLYHFVFSRHKNNEIMVPLDSLLKEKEMIEANIKNLKKSIYEDDESISILMTKDQTIKNSKCLLDLKRDFIATFNKEELIFNHIKNHNKSLTVE